MTSLLQPYCSSRVKPPSQLWESLNMRKMFITLAATSALALGVCQSPQADKVEDQAEAQAEAIDDQADAMPDGPAQDAMENKADVVEEMGEEKANAMDDNGEIAPSESGVGDTQTRTEERRGGTEWVRTCRSRWAPDN